MLAWLSTTAWKEGLRAQVDGGHAVYLGSFHDLGRNPGKLDMITPNEFRFFLDSGAYSAWSKNSAIDLDEYCAFIKANIEKIEAYACLDVIPGAPGRSATAAERETAAEATWRNFLYMQREGLQPLPVFHYGEPWRFLDRMLAHGCDYVGIGGLVSVPSKERRAWLDDLFLRICDADGFPKVKTHGFGMTALVLMFRYPWHSVDSTTWIKITANGAVYLPQLVDGEFVFDQTPSVIVVSANNPKANQDQKHGDSLPPAHRAILDRWLAYCGKTYEECKDNYFHRAVVNVTFFREVSRAKMGRPFKPYTVRQQGLL